jgi:ABC-type phosphate transport system substrate-binding protein
MGTPRPLARARRDAVQALWLAGLVLGGLCGPTTSTAREPALVVIVHASRSEPLDKTELRRIYLKQRRTWADGSPIVPVNRETGSPEREQFRQRVLQMAPERLAAYWNERYFEGIFPPITLSSDLAVYRYVASHPNAVGYVRAEEVGPGVRVVLRLE